MHTLQNQYIQIQVKPQGAELCSLIDKSTGREWMWQADPAYWAKSSPVLFPIVGALKNNQYRYQGATYTLPRHGFARDREFQLEASGADFLQFLLESDPQTKEVYPFDFSLRIRYVLEDTTLRVQYEVSNTGDGEMYFSLGAHPAFSLAVDGKKRYSDYRLFFADDEVLHLHPLQDNVLLKETDTLSLQDGYLPLSYELFQRDALVTTTLQSKRIRLDNTVDGESLLFAFDNFPHFGIWAAKGADFVCLEPWAGIADFEDHDGDITKKYGINRLDRGMSWKAEFMVSCRP